MNTYEYKQVAVASGAGPHPTFESVANDWAERGWRTVGLIPPIIGSLSFGSILVERLKEEKVPITFNTIHNHHPDRLCDNDCPVYREANPGVD